MKKLLPFLICICCVLTACSNGDGPKESPSDPKKPATQGQQLISQGIDSLIYDPVADTIVIK